ncbi:MAG TPA: hypothetical protein VIY08_00390 [Candidatus Nitrosocosmicus sp.]
MNNALLVIGILAAAFTCAFIVNTFANTQSAQACPNTSGTTSSSNSVVKSNLNNPQPSSQLTSGQKA